MNAKFSAYCFHINTNISEDFQICISVSLKNDYYNNDFCSGALTCVSISDQGCKIRPALININNNESNFPYSVFVKKYSGNCNVINDHMLNYVSNVVKDISINVRHLFSRTNETHHMILHETCAWECRLDASYMIMLCDYVQDNDKHHWNRDKCKF